MSRLFSTLLILATALLAHAGITQSDFTGIGHIYVLKSDNWQTATPDSKVGCLNDNGKFVSLSSNTCGTFSRLNDYPYTLSTKHGNCTFEDTTQPTNTDSIYGKGDYAYSCREPLDSGIYDELYTIDGFPYVFLCFGDVACFYDAKKIPAGNEVVSLWQYHWGSQQLGITPGHVQLQLLWEKIGDTPKRQGEKKIPGPRIEISEGMQVRLEGAKAKG